MKVYNTLSIPCSHSGHIVTVGGFDGVHLGHQSILKEMVRISKVTRIPSLVITFLHPPKFMLEGITPPELLTLPQEKEEILKKFDIDEVVVLKFDETLRETTARDFLEKELIQKIKARWFVLGFNHAFGKGREGTQEFLAKHLPDFGYGLTIVPPVVHNNIPASSSNIRKLLREGDLETASKLLGYPYTVTGEVVAGAGLGKGIGFPTINIDVHPFKVLPSNGVYAVEVFLRDVKYIGAANIGVAPTLQKRSELVLEVHLLNFDHKQTYGEKVKVRFIRRIRPEIRFKSSDELRSQIFRDIETVKIIFERAKD